MARLETMTVTPSTENDPTAQLAAALSVNLKRFRTRKGLSLERLSTLSGVSRAMLGQIETGKSIPTISLLWKVATALETTFSSLISTAEGSGVQVLRLDKAKTLESSGGRFTSRALFPFDQARRTEFYELTISPRHTEQAEAHLPGTVENLVVSEGSLEITIAGEGTHRLEKGDSLVFRADVSHSYGNPGTKSATVFLVMTYAETIGG